MRDNNHISGLHFIRFGASFGVVTYHYELYKSIISNGSWQRYRPVDGNLLVTCFFCLSGFLITTLLLREQKANGKISLKQFYIRRAYRILPLYYLTVILGLLVWPLIFQKTLPLETLKPYFDHRATFICLYLVLCPQIVFSFFGQAAALAHLWSIGVEELFYLFWPVVLKLRFTILPTIIVVQVGTLVLKYFLYRSNSGWMTLVFQSQFNGVLIGAICAFILQSFPKFREKRINDFLAISTLLGICALLFRGTNFRFVNNEIYSVLFSLLIFFSSTSKFVANYLDGAVIRKLGELSYGLYMHHPAVLFLYMPLLLKFGNPSARGISWNVFFEVLGLSLCLGVSYLSYRFMEAPILKLRSKSHAIAAVGNLTEAVEPRRKMVNFRR